MQALVDTFNQEKALVGAFSVIVKPMDSFTALISTLLTPQYCAALQHRRRAEIWRFHPRMMVNRRNSISWPLCECLHSEAMPINSAFVAPKQLNMSQLRPAVCWMLDTGWTVRRESKQNRELVSRVLRRFYFPTKMILAQRLQQ